MTASRPGVLVLLLLLPGLYVAWRIWPPPLPRGRRRVSLSLRSALVTLLVLALADTQLQREPDHRALVVVVDLSDSARVSRQEAAAAVESLLAAKGPDDLVGVVTFGRNAEVEVPPSREAAFDTFQTRPDGSYSNIGDALELAANVIPDGYARQVVLLSDGRQNLGDAAAVVSSLRSRSVRVDVLPTGPPPAAEALVLSLDAPQEVRVGESLELTARLRSSDSARGRLSLQVDGKEVEAREVGVPAGVSAQTFGLPPLEQGVHRLRAVLDAQPDGYSQNNESGAVVRVVGRPTVLLLEGPSGAGRNVAAALTAAGMDVETRPARDTPTEVTVLAAYDAFVVADAPATAFPPGALEAVATAVRDLGRGLVATGGRRSYGPGGWRGTPLEEALPVRMELPRPRERPSVAAAVVIETMESDFGDAVARGALESIVDELRADDELAVVGMRHPSAGGPYDIVPLTHPLDKAAIKQRIRTAQLGDPPGYASSIDRGIDVVAPSGAASKHVIVVGDGDAVSDIDGYGPLVDAARASGVTVSVIGADTHSTVEYMDHMRSIAEVGGGVYYQSDTPSEIPEVLLAAARSTLRPWIEQSPFFPEITSAGDVLSGVPLDAFPQLGGYVATTAKPTADVVLSSPKRDPVLAAGQHGLGRTVAWTSDTDGQWTGALLRSPVSAPLLGRMVAWSLAVGAREKIRIDAAARGDGMDLTVTGPEEGGDLRVQVVSPAGASTTEQLRPVAPGRWQGLVPAVDVGTYVVHGVVRRAGTIVAEGEVSVPVPYSPEYLELGLDLGLLRQLAADGGAVLGRADTAWSQPVRSNEVSTPLVWALLLLAVLLWPVDIAVRRLTVSPRQIAKTLRQTREARRQDTVLSPELEAMRSPVESSST